MFDSEGYFCRNTVFICLCHLKVCIYILCSLQKLQQSRWEYSKNEKLIDLQTVKIDSSTYMYSPSVVQRLFHSDWFRGTRHVSNMK
jgi:hypothetical protein